MATHSPSEFLALEAFRIKIGDRITREMRKLSWQEVYRQMMDDIVRRNPGLADDSVRAVMIDTGVMVVKDDATEQDKQAAMRAAGWVKPDWAIPDDVPERAIVRPPGHFLLLLIAWLPIKDLRTALTQSVADMRDEHFAALQGGDFAEAKRVLVRGRLTVVLMIIPLIAQWAWGLVSFLRKWFGASP